MMKLERQYKVVVFGESIGTVLQSHFTQYADKELNDALGALKKGEVHTITLAGGDYTYTYLGTKRVEA